MLLRIISFILLFMLFNTSIPAQKKERNLIKWRLGAVLPAPDSQSKSLGFAGAIHGISNNVLIIAGGANFPNGMPWEGGKKYYSNSIYVLQKVGNKLTWNKKATGQLPEPLAYCGNTSTGAGIVAVGGENEHGISNKCYLLTWDATNNKVNIKHLPDLPTPLTNVAVTHIDNIVYAAGGDENQNSSSRFFCIDLGNTDPQWRNLPDLPVALANATAVAQSGKNGKEIFIIGGRTKNPSGISDLHNTSFAFNISKQAWEECAAISDGNNSISLSAASGVALGKNEILMTGGDNGRVFHQIEVYTSQINKAGTPEEKERLTKEKNNLNIHHAGFDKSLLLFNTVNNSWRKIGELPFQAHVTTTAVMWDNEIIISNGEIKPGVRTPDVMAGKLSKAAMRE